MKKILITIIFIIMPFLGFLIRLLSPGDFEYIKFIKVGFFLLAIFIILLYVNTRIKRSVIQYYFVLFTWFYPYLYHFIFSRSIVEKFNSYAFSEIVVFVFLFFAFFLLSMFTFSLKEYNFLIWILAFFGVFLSIESIVFSFLYTAEMYLNLYVGDLIRAGAEVTDPNLLRALLNMLSFAAFSLVFLHDRLVIKGVALFSFLVTQVGGLFTFSNGGFLSFVITIILLAFFMKGRNRISYIVWMTSFVLVVSALVLLSGYGEILFYRLSLSDEATQQSSVFSRLEQYDAFLKLIIRDPKVLLTGVGSALLPEKLGLPVSLHNSVLRSLAIGGVVSFISYLYLNFLTLKNFLFVINNSKRYEIHMIGVFFLSAFLGWLFQSLTLPFECSGINMFFMTFAYSLTNTLKEYD